MLQNNFHGNVLVGVIVLIAALSMWAFTHKRKNSWTKHRLRSELSQLGVPHRAWDEGALRHLLHHLNGGTVIFTGPVLNYATVRVHIRKGKAQSYLHDADLKYTEDFLAAGDEPEARAKCIACEVFGKTEGVKIRHMDTVDLGTFPSERHLGLSSSLVRHIFVCELNTQVALQEATA